ncbi:MAG: peptidoglycan-binding domain-containing protein [Candidatus Omnitrophica bacterium]|nr:peptidoglycan-binding domain-containing protein [Candidatus Omnitrophota bacterium]MDD5574344.1 peptidoglycan-binding domain-containing protein [Candidatus Omnitrophota bacterium]
MNILWVVVGALAAAMLTVSGCGKGADKKQKFVVGEEMLNLTEADTILSGSASADEAIEIVDNGPQAPTDMAVEVPVPVPQDPPAAVFGDDPDEKAIQTALKNLGLYAGSIDGKVGPRTREAIREFQRQNGLVVDGKVGPKTRAALKNSLASMSQTQP